MSVPGRDGRVLLDDRWPAGRELVDLLTDLKDRSGRSYERIGALTYLSRSTVHRYCTGVSRPATFGPLERIAVACGANKRERSRLYYLWERASHAEPVAEPVVAPVAEPRARPRWFRRILGVFAGTASAE